MSDDSKSEERELFAEKFKPAERKRRKCKKISEHTAARKMKELDPSQPKITEFGRLVKKRDSKKVSGDLTGSSSDLYIHSSAQES